MTGLTKRYRKLMWHELPEAQLGVSGQIRLYYQYKPGCEFLT